MCLTTALWRWHPTSALWIPDFLSALCCGCRASLGKHAADRLSSKTSQARRQERAGPCPVPAGPTRLCCMQPARAGRPRCVGAHMRAPRRAVHSNPRALTPPRLHLPLPPWQAAAARRPRRRPAAPLPGARLCAALGPRAGAVAQRAVPVGGLAPPTPLSAHLASCCKAAAMPAGSVIRAPCIPWRACRACKLSCTSVSRVQTACLGGRLAKTELSCMRWSCGGSRRSVPCHACWRLRLVRQWWPFTCSTEHHAMLASREKRDHCNDVLPAVHSAGKVRGTHDAQECCRETSSRQRFDFTLAGGTCE